MPLVALLLIGAVQCHRDAHAAAQTKPAMPAYQVDTTWPPPDADQQLLYVADFGNGQVVVLNRKTLEVLGSIGSQGSQPGQFQNIHHIAVDSNGTLYTAEVAPGRPFQKLVRKSASTR